MQLQIMEMRIYLGLSRVMEALGSFSLRRSMGVVVLEGLLGMGLKELRFYAWLFVGRVEVKMNCVLLEFSVGNILLINYEWLFNNEECVKYKREDYSRFII